MSRHPGKTQNLFFPIFGLATMASPFWNRLAGLGFKTYADYLRGEHWKTFKATYRARGGSLRCAVCNGTPVQMHHHTYARLGYEQPPDITPLCRQHHVEVHEILKRKNWTVKKTATVVEIIKFRIWKKAALATMTNVEFKIACAKKKRQDCLDECKALIAEGYWSNAIPKGWVPNFRDKYLFRHRTILRRVKKKRLLGQ